MGSDIQIILGSVVPVFGVVAVSYLYCRRFRPDLSTMLRVTAGFFIPCFVLTSLLEADVAASDVRSAALATALQIVVGLTLGVLVLRLLGKGDRRELLLPIAFVNSANLPLPIVLSHFGPEGVSFAIVCFLTTSMTVFTVGNFILHGKGRWADAAKEPVLWATLVALAIRLTHIELPGAVLGIAELAGQAAVPLMLFLFGNSLARTPAGSFGPALVATAVRYAGGWIAILLTLKWLAPTGMLRSVLILYAFMPAAVVTVVLTERAGRKTEEVASTILLTTLVSLFLIPWILAQFG